ncbi:sugar ABC transporter substrate-binding protein [Mesorhizobium sp. B1-1-8]|uniref:sugar ABC transporter substrate-binding protein n=1 Tax=Mesorhizobium sp. B1-1-8 TaxID=2589976 RepID=UPI001128614E|nr:sugar ABC transporter substrate-binding protein [Mesorhizobium sp. B1-1-8]UCI05175.1 sugar ABC transporter substrate-binding protein [Mesorhizobium sp. B1-1-8]
MMKELTKGSGAKGARGIVGYSLLAGLSMPSLTRHASSHKRIIISYINPSVANQGWIVIGQGAKDAAMQRGVELRTYGPSQGGDVAGQVSVTQDQIAAGVQALVIAPVNSSALVMVVKEANAAKIPVVNLDSSIDGGELASFVATNNYEAASIQAKAVADLIGARGKVVLINGSQVYSTGRDRRNGFVDTMTICYPHVDIVEVQTDWSAGQAQQGLRAVLSSNSDIVAIANAWDGATVAAASVLSERKSGERIVLVGFDGAGDAIALMKQGKVAAIVAQRLYKMGYTAVDTAVNAACGEKVRARIDTGSILLTPQTVDGFVEDNPHMMRVHREGVKPLRMNKAPA